MTIDEASSVLLEKRADLQKWIDCVLNPEETYPEICAHAKALDVVLSAIHTQQEHKSPCAACGYGGKHLDAPPCTNCPAHPKEAEKNEPQYAERVKLYDDIRCDRLMTTCSWCYGRVGPHDKFCKHCGREFRDNSTSSKEAPNA